MAALRSAVALLAVVTSIAPLASLAAWGTISISRTLHIDGQAYYLPIEPVVSPLGVPISEEVLPFTVINTNSSQITDDTIKNAIASFTSSDDVFSDSFLRGVFIIGTGSATFSRSASTYVDSLGVTKVLISGIKDVSFSKNTPIIKVSRISLPDGPYVFATDISGTSSIYKPYKLLFDETQSFYKSVHPLKNGSFTVISASLDTDSSPYIGVPSRIYASSKDRSQFPLAGVRVTVKDIYFLQGITASCGNRAFYQTYGRQNTTGPAVQRLVDLGADIVGITKTVQFANGDRATADWVDYHAPFSLRGDGYVEPSGSSTGAGASTGAHDWLDVGIGSDTGGSIRLPAGVNGLYGIRPSVGAVSLYHVMPLSSVLDTPGYVYGPRPEALSSVRKGLVWRNHHVQIISIISEVIASPTDFQRVSGPAMEIFSEFFAKLQSFLGASIGNFSVVDQWNVSSGVDSPVNIFMNETYSTLITFGQWTQVGSKLFADYAAANGGRNPHINPSVLARWKYGIMRGEANFTDEVSRQQTFENWTANNFLVADAGGCSKSIYLYPQNIGIYNSRELYFLGPSTPPVGFSDNRIAVYARSPEVVVPIGQIPFNSTITGLQEMLPVSVSMVARRGCDFMLLDLVAALADKGLVQPVKTGRTAF